MRKADKESGMVIVEATIVFPVMFLVIFLLIFMGNAYLQKARVEAIVNELTLEGASRCTTPIMTDVVNNGSVPDFENYSTNPYRYLLGGMDAVEQDIASELENRLKNMSTGLFSGMVPTDYTVMAGEDGNVKFNNLFVYSTFSIDLNYKIVLPIRLMGADENFSLNLSSYNESPVMDSPDFIQNTNMVEVYLERAGIAQRAEEGLAQITKMTEKFNEWFK